jgi:D-methionine transport system ATP-binding protein
MNMSEMIQVKNLSKTFQTREGTVEALRNIDLTVEAGDIYGIIGMSGAGKSTLVRCLNYLERPTAGTVIVQGRELGTLSDRELRKMRSSIGMIFQNFNLLSRLNVFDNVALPLRFSGLNPNSPENRRRILDLVELVGLSDKLKAKPRELSGGQKQRVAIARALVLNPRILLCDEATSALDPRITQGILGLLTQIRDELNITVVVVTHQMEVVKQICERVSFLKHGGVIQEGRPEELFVMPNEDIRTFLGKGEETLPTTGRNIRVYFMENAEEVRLISAMARALDVDFSICRADMADFRGHIMGSLVLNVRESDEDRVLEYLRNTDGITEEVIENV